MPDDESADAAEGPSAPKPDYRIRPAKSIVRKMVAEALRKLSHFDKLTEYSYVGLGGLFFADFVLVHKNLGIKDMVSIERNTGAKARYEFNRPFSCVRVVPGESHDVLPSLPASQWAKPVILWLDYEGVLDGNKLNDVGTFCRLGASGSVIVVTVNAQPPDLGLPGARLDELRRRVGRERIPAFYNDANLGDWGTAEAMRAAILSAIDEILAGLNGSRNENDALEFHQLFDFHYRDGARMLTFGGILSQHRDGERVRACRFDELVFVRARGEAPEDIDSPLLTFRETRSLDQTLPAGDEAKWDPAIPIDQARAYKKLYRYFPSFVEAEL